MRKSCKFFISVLIVFALGGCSKREDIIVYTGYDESWLATYSPSLIEDRVYDLIFIWSWVSNIRLSFGRSIIYNF